jgi:hypothetical protein
MLRHIAFAKSSFLLSPLPCKGWGESEKNLLSLLQNSPLTTIVILSVAKNLLFSDG